MANETSIVETGVIRGTRGPIWYWCGVLALIGAAKGALKGLTRNGSFDWLLYMYDGQVQRWIMMISICVMLIGLVFGFIRLAIRFELQLRKHYNFIEIAAWDECGVTLTQKDFVQWDQIEKINFSANALTIFMQDRKGRIDTYVFLGEERDQCRALVDYFWYKKYSAPAKLAVEAKPRLLAHVEDYGKTMSQLRAEGKNVDLLVRHTQDWSMDRERIASGLQAQLMNQRDHASDKLG
jgi:hypothetical protein